MPQPAPGRIRRALAIARPARQLTAFRVDSADPRRVIRMRQLSLPIPRSASAAAVLAVMLAAAPVEAQSPFVARACPVPAGVQGYPVSARAADGAALDSAFARSLADAVARRWEPPSRRRGTFAGLGRLRDRMQPPEPRFPDDWAPSANHVARVGVTLRRAGGADARLTAPSGDEAFDRSIIETFARGAPGGPELPALPAGLDSVRVDVAFGAAPEDGAAAVRFAVQQSPVTVVQGTLQVARPRTAGTSIAPPSATVKYDVDAQGRIVPASIEVLASTDRSMDRQIREGLLRARFIPAQSNCRAVPLSVVQVFGGR